MATPVNELNRNPETPEIPVDAIKNVPPIPKGIGSAPTVLESAPENPKAAKPLEPGVFETMVVAIKDFIIFLFKSLWNCLFRKTETPPKTADASVQTDSTVQTNSAQPVAANASEDLTGKQLQVALVPSIPK